MTINDVNVGNVATLTSKNDKEPQTITGVITGKVSYTIAKVFDDLIQYHQEVLETNPGLPDPENLDYFIIESETQEGVARVFAPEWVDTYNETSINTDLDVRIFNKDSSELPAILSLLRNNGYAASAI